MLTRCSHYERSGIPFKAFFAEFGVEGTFLLQELNSGKTRIFNKTRAAQPFLPASTFKILNALIALETGAIADTNTALKWDGIERSIKQWNHDHNLRSAMQVSAVWFYQEMARRIGVEKMQQFVRKSNYGNKNISGKIDAFWLDGEIRISALQQIDFLKHFYRGELPFAAENIEKVKAMLIVEQGDDYILRAKTGWGGDSKPQIGWYIGYLEKQNEVYFFATNIAIYKAKDAKAPKAIMRRIFHQLNLLPQ